MPLPLIHDPDPNPCDQVGAPGLVKGRYITLPSAPPKPASKEGSYGGFDGTCADMRGDTPPGLDPDKLPGTP